ncbi:MAG: efflux RND transporter periplasmic adaptor subunit [Holophagales bacterium]|nr:efflux RND transporter periplasmic adaptor subunit [Holophagales bacterium]
MPRRLPRVLLAVGLLLVPAVVVVRIFTAKPVDESVPATAPTDAVTLGEKSVSLAGIEVVEAKGVTRAATFDAPAVLALDETRTARIGSLVEGDVVRILSEVGSRVGRGAVLAELNSRVVHDAWADYRKAVSERRRRETELAWATQAAERAGRLHEQKALSLQERQRAETDQVAAREELDQTRTEVRRAEEALEHLGVTNKEDPTGETGESVPVRAPLAGVVLEKNVTAGTTVTPGTLLFVVSDLTGLWAMAEVDETRIPLVAAGRPAKVHVAAWPDRAFDAQVTFVGDAVNPKTRRVTVRCQVPNPGGLLKPEMYARVALGESAPRPMVVVPEAAIQEMDGKPYVFVAGAKGRFEKREVALGASSEGLVEIRSGVAAGEKVATQGSFLLKSQLLSASAPAEE